MIKIPSSENVHHPWSGKQEKQAEKIFSLTYPSIYAWWLKEGYRSALIQRYDQGHYFWELRSCTYWDSFARPKIVSTKISIQPTFAVDRGNHILGNTSYFFSSETPEYACAVLNSSVGHYLSRQIFVQKQGGFYEVQPTALEAMPIPASNLEQKSLLALIVRSIQSRTRSTDRLESLVNAFVYELFFPEEFSLRKISTFAAARDEGLSTLVGLSGDALARQAEAWSAVLTDPNSRLYATLFEIQSIDAVRTIEGR